MELEPRIGNQCRPVFLNRLGEDRSGDVAEEDKANDKPSYERDGDGIVSVEGQGTCEPGCGKQSLRRKNAWQSAIISLHDQQTAIATHRGRKQP